MMGSPTLRTGLFVALASLAACGNASQFGGADEVTATVSATLSRLADGQRGNVPDVATLIDRAREMPGPSLVAQIPARKDAWLLRPSGRNQNHVTWRAEDGQSVTLRAGILTATRGLGYDLMSADVGAIAVLIAARRTGSAPRVMRYLNGEGLETSTSFTCDISRATTAGQIVVMTEACVAPDQNFTNQYWVRADGTPNKSTQWIGPTLGTMTLVTVP